ncbi:MAG: hypothetical protein ACODAD_05430 [Planctomycetota bacterium]
MFKGSMRRRHFLATCGGASATLAWPRWATARAADAPTNDPLDAYKLDWTGQLQWTHVVSIEAVPGDNWDQRFANAQRMLRQAGGGVLYCPAGTYRFRDSLKIADGVVVRGADPTGVTRATNDRYDPPTRFEFPRYKPTFEGDGTPIHTAFKGIYLADPAVASNCGVVNVAINRGHVHFDEDDKHKVGTRRIVVGCVLRNAAVADPRVPSDTLGQHAWQRFTHRHFAAIDVKGPGLLIANNRLPKSGDDNFIMKGFKLKPNRGSASEYDVTFDYDNRPGLYINHYCVGGSGGSGNDGTPESHPHGFRKGVVIRDNYIYNTGRMAIGFCGDGTHCLDNVVRFATDVWRPTNTGLGATSGSSTNDNRAIEMRGWRWRVEGNDYQVHRNWAAQRAYRINDGEGLMHEDHCNSDLRGSVLRNNRGNSYLSIYKCGPIDGLLVEGNDISVPGDIADIYVVANRNSGPQPCRNVSIVNNTTRANGIYIAGQPASNNVIRGNVHKGERKGYIKNEANAKVQGNKGYEV